MMKVMSPVQANEGLVLNCFFKRLVSTLKILCFKILHRSDA